MKSPTHVQIIDPQGQRCSLPIPEPLAQALQLHPGDVLECSLQKDSSLLLKRQPSPPAPAEAAKKGGS